MPMSRCPWYMFRSQRWCTIYYGLVLIKLEEVYNLFCRNAIKYSVLLSVKRKRRGWEKGSLDSREDGHPQEPACDFSATRKTWLQDVSVRLDLSLTLTSSKLAITKGFLLLRQVLQAHGTECEGRHWGTKSFKISCLGTFGMNNSTQYIHHAVFQHISHAI